MTSKTFQLLQKPRELDTLLSEDDEIKQKEKTNQCERQQMQQLVNDFQLFLKAQQEKHRLESISKESKQKVKTQQRISAIDQILLQTKRRLRLNPTTKQMKFDSQFKNFKNVDTYLEIKEFLEGINTLKEQKKQVLPDGSQIIHPEINKLPPIQKNQKIQLAKKSIDNFHNQQFEGLRVQLDSLYLKQKEQLVYGKEQNPDDLFYLDIMNSVNRQVLKFNNQQEREKIEAEKTSPGESQANLIITFDQEKMFQRQANKVRQIMKNVSEDMFKKKWGNAMMKKKRQKVEGKKLYDSNRIIEIQNQLEGLTHLKTQTDETNESPKKSQLYHHSLMKQQSIILRRGGKLQNQKTMPPSYFQSLKAQNELILQACNKQFRSFQDEMPGLRTSIKEVVSETEQYMDQLVIKDEKYRKYQ